MEGIGARGDVDRGAGGQIGERRFDAAGDRGRVTVAQHREIRHDAVRPGEIVGEPEDRVNAAVIRVRELRNKPGEGPTSPVPGLAQSFFDRSIAAASNERTNKHLRVRRVVGWLRPRGAPAPQLDGAVFQNDVGVEIRISIGKLARIYSPSLSGRSQNSIGAVALCVNRAKGL